MINLVLAIALMISAFILVMMLPEIEDKREKQCNIMWVLCDVVLAIINLATYRGR